MSNEDTQFKKGWKGGPGRPKGSISIKDEIRKKLLQNPERFEELVEFYMKEEAPVFRKLLWEMLEGKPKESVDMEVTLPKPIMDVDVPKEKDE